LVLAPTSFFFGVREECTQMSSDLSSNPPAVPVSGETKVGESAPATIATPAAAESSAGSSGSASSEAMRPGTAAAGERPKGKLNIQVGTRRAEVVPGGRSRSPLAKGGGSRSPLSKERSPGPRDAEGVEGDAGQADSAGDQPAAKGPRKVTNVLEPPKPVPIPSRREPVSEDLQREIDAALGEMSLDDLLVAPVTTQASREVERDVRRLARVLRVHGDDVFFALDGRHEGVASLRAFPAPPAAGEQWDVIVRGFNAEDGFYEVAIPGQSIDVSDWADLDEGSVVEARVTAANTGGLECMVNNIRGFIPASQVSMYRVEDFSEFVGQRLMCVATEVNPRRKNLVLSHRAVLEREKEEARQKLLEELEPGQIREGVVRAVRDFGVFVDLGGVDGLIHVSQLSWERIKHPSEVVQEGQKVKVKVEKVNPETGKISLSYRDLLEHPWENIDARFPIGSIHKGPVTRTAKFGAFVRLASGVEGLIHVSELAHRRIRRVEDVVKEGDEVAVKILSVEREAQRISLSIKATQAKPEELKAETEEVEEPAPQPVVKPRNAPLKGGVDRPSGGDSFGLNW
jgi:small subunit ribosomal protein S1